MDPLCHTNILYHLGSFINNNYLNGLVWMDSRTRTNKNGKVSKITDKNNQDMKRHKCPHPEKDMVHKRKPYQS